MLELKSIQVQGFRSIKEMEQPFDIGRINVLIGANGAGKSNLIALFRMLHSLSGNGFARWVQHELGGGAQLYHGPAVTPEMRVSLRCMDEGQEVWWQAICVAAQPDRLLIDEEHLVDDSGAVCALHLRPTARGGPESRLEEVAAGRSSLGLAGPAKMVLNVLSRTRVSHFQDTSATARVHRQQQIEDKLELKRDGANLAARLLYLREASPAFYGRIRSVVQQVAPFFDDFVLVAEKPQHRTVLLRWREVGSDMTFDSYALPDGLLRFILLTVLLLQPAEDLPAVIVIDEPELGLHPAAIHALGAMVHTASQFAQVIMTTQSPVLLDLFDENDVIVVNRHADSVGRFCSTFERVDKEGLAIWLDEYQLGELWQRNILGGTPF